MTAKEASIEKENKITKYLAIAPRSAFEQFCDLWNSVPYLARPHIAIAYH